MLSDFNEIRHVQYLHSRMHKIKNTYKTAFLFGFGIYAALLVYFIGYTYTKFIVLGFAYVSHAMSEAVYDGVNFAWVPDALQSVCIVAAFALSFLAFRMRRKIPKFLLPADNLILCVVSVVKLLRGEDFNISVFAVCSCIVSTVFCIVCMRADAEEAKMSEIEGYPHFDPLLMTERPLEEQFLYRFDDKADLNELSEKRDIEYFEEHPDSEGARIYYRQKEEEREQKIDSWLDSIIGEDEK